MPNPSDAQTTPTRLRVVEDVFHEALAQPEDDRAAWVKRRCGDDLELLRQVERLLAADRGGENFLSAPALGPEFVMPSPGALGETQPTRRVGPYQLLRLLGSGGIGHVWLARRDDEHFRKVVALKLIKRGMDTDAILERFKQERQVLARLEHPHIARLIDGGATEEGSPYLVMEYVDGLPIDRYCRDHGLNVEERLHLFLDVCAAVQYAHQNLVVHRDIKPGNILVAADDEAGTKENAETPKRRNAETSAADDIDPKSEIRTPKSPAVSSSAQPKVIDFGIAKVLHSDAATPLTVTGAEMRLLTPEYASPEQLRGQPVTTASDVYSLGVVLYEMLTGRRPHKAATRAAYEQLVCERDAARPSMAVRRVDGGRSNSGPQQAAGRLGGDIDAILLKALSREPRERYASVERFAEDIRRHLARLPVQARPPTVIYRTRRFVRRNLISVIAAAAFVGLLAGSAVVSTAFYFEAVRERDRAEAALQGEKAEREKAVSAQAQAQRESEKAVAINRFIEDMLGQADRSNVGGRENVTVRETLDAASQRLLKGKVKSDPEVEADLRMAMGEIYLNLSLVEPALGHFLSALELRRSKFGPDHESVASSLNYLGRVYRSLGRFADAEAVQREALRLRRALGVENDLYVAQSLNSLAISLRNQGKYAEAEPMYREALAIYRTKLGEVNESYPAVLDALGVTLVQLGRGEEALQCHERALALYDRWSGGELRPGTPLILNNWASALGAQGRAEEALVKGRHALELARKLHGERHDYVARIQFALSRWLVSLDRSDEAEPLLRAAADTYRSLLGDENPLSSDALSEHARLLLRLGRFGEAELACRDALTAGERTKPDAAATDLLRVLRGVLLRWLGQAAEAEASVAEGLDGLRRAGIDPCALDPAERLSELLDAWESSEQACGPCPLAARWLELATELASPP